MIDMPIKMPAMKLPASRNLAREFLIIHPEPDVIAALPKIVRAME
jgi:hypothetical protein